jgi:hypothetical protein
MFSNVGLARYSLFGRNDMNDLDGCYQGILPAVVRRAKWDYVHRCLLPSIVFPLGGV